MNCYTHSQKEAVTRCSECGNYICEECAVDVNGRYMCKKCVEKVASGRGSGHGERNHYRRSRPPMAPGMPEPIKDINAFFLFCLSAIPGLNYMYMGLMKRGLFFMSSFFLLIFLTAFLSAPSILFIVFILMCYSFFDGFNYRRHILLGEYVKDDVNDIAPFFIKYKGIIIMGVVLVAALSAFKKLGYYFERVFYNLLGDTGYWFLYDFFNTLIGGFIIIAGIFIIYRAFINKNSDSQK